MCLQFVCHICGQDLEDDKSILLCFGSGLTPLLKFGDHRNCNDYVRIEAGAPNRCNSCLMLDPSAAGAFVASTNPASNYIELALLFSILRLPDRCSSLSILIRWLLTQETSSFLSQPPVDGSTSVTTAPLPSLSVYRKYSPSIKERKRTEVSVWGYGTTASIHETKDENRRNSAPSRGLFGHMR